MRSIIRPKIAALAKATGKPSHTGMPIWMMVHHTM